MKRAIAIPGKVSISSAQEEELKKIVAKSKSRYLSIGEVDATLQPEWVLALVKDAVSRLNLASHPTPVRSRFALSSSHKVNGWVVEKPTLVYGQGSVGAHNDNMSGISLLTLLTCYTPEGLQEPTYQAVEGEFYAGGRVTTLRVGESLVFDDRESHSWLCNNSWIFACNPLKKNK